MITKENAYLVLQLIEALEETAEKLQKAQQQENSSEINKAKNHILELQNKISTNLKND